MDMISFPTLYFCSIIMMTLSCHIVNVKPKVKMKNEDVDVLWVCVCVANFLIFSYLCARVLQEKIVLYAPKKSL